MAIFTKTIGTIGGEKRVIRWGVIWAMLTPIIISLIIAGMMLRVVSIEPTEIGVKVNKPYIFGSASTEEESLKTGRHWMFSSSTVVKFPSIPVRKDLFFDDLVTSDNNPVDFHINVSIVINPEKAAYLYTTFGRKFWKSFVEDPLRTHVREYTKSKSMFEMTTNSQVSKEMQVNVKTFLVKFLKDNKIPVTVKVVAVGKVLPQKAIIEETIRTGVARQAKRTQIENQKMQVQRKQTEIARAEADKAYMETFNMSANQYLEFLRLKVQEKAVANGANVSLIMGNAQPMVDVTPKK